MKIKLNNFSFENGKVFIGIDVHKKDWKVTILGEQVSHKTFSQDPCPDVLHKYLIKHFPDAEFYSAYEAGFCGFWTHDRLEELGVHSIVVNPSDIPTTDKEKRQKEDKRDSRKIARCLLSGGLTPIRVPSKKNRHDRSLLRARKAVLKDLQRYKNRIKGMLYFTGIDYPEQFKQSGNHWSKAFMRWLESIDIEESGGQQTLSLYIENIYFLRGQLLKSTRNIRALARTAFYDKNVKLLLSIPGIGILTAMTILAELEDIRNYKNINKLCSYIGVVPSTNSSSDNERVGNITPRGKNMLRSMLIESAWVAIRNDPALMKKYNQLCKRMSGNKAIVRITKKLISRIKFVLFNQQPYKILV